MDAFDSSQRSGSIITDTATREVAAAVQTKWNKWVRLQIFGWRTYARQAAEVSTCLSLFLTTLAPLAGVDLRSSNPADG